VTAPAGVSNNARGKKNTQNERKKNINRATNKEKEQDMLYKNSCENCTKIINNSVQFNSFIYVLDNSQIRPITAKHKNNSTG
jgi:hypothetical protein